MYDFEGRLFVGCGSCSGFVDSDRNGILFEIFHNEGVDLWKSEWESIL